MRAVVSRVSTAAVTVEGAAVGEIGAGLLALVGVGHDDDVAQARALARKIHELRIFPGDDGEQSAADLGLPVLVVSQFTLYADTRKGRRPSWQDAAPGDVAEPLVDEVVGRAAPARLRRGDRRVRGTDERVVGQRGPDDTAARGLSATAEPTAAGLRVAPRRVRGRDRRHSLRFAVNRAHVEHRARYRAVVQGVPHRTEEQGAGRRSSGNPGT